MPSAYAKMKVVREIEISDRSEASPENVAEMKRVQLLQIPPLFTNFQFDKFQTIWITSKADWENFWRGNSRNKIDAPSLPLNWKTEALLGVFWQGLDQIVTIPSFQGAQFLHTDRGNAARLVFHLSKPCAGIFTDISPSQFLIVDKDWSDLDTVYVTEQTTQATGCY